LGGLFFQNQNAVPLELNDGTQIFFLGVVGQLKVLVLSLLGTLNYGGVRIHCVVATGGGPHLGVSFAQLLLRNNQVGMGKQEFWIMFLMGVEQILLVGCYSLVVKWSILFVQSA
jgi:hypothetical protein